MKKLKEKGITLVSLVVTIIVLLILASISIRMVLGENGVIKKAKDAKEIYENSEDNQTETMSKYSNELKKLATTREIQEKAEKYQEDVESYYSNNTNSNQNTVDSENTINIDFEMDAKDVIYVDNAKLKEIIRQFDNGTLVPDETIESYKGPDYDVYIMNDEEKQSAKQFLIDNFNDITEENVDEIWNYLYKDEQIMREIFPSMDSNDLKKFVIQDGKLRYNPSNVTDQKERSALEKIGIVAMDIFILMIVSLQGKPVKIKMMPNRVKIPAVPQRFGPGGVGDWFYYDENGEYHAPSAGDNISLNKVVLQNSYSFGCFVEGTKISLADGSKKNIEDITYEDKLSVWNFDEGKNDTADVLWLMKKLTSDKYTYLKFDNGAELKIIKHRLFDVEKQEFVRGHIDEEFPIGSVVFMEDGTTAKLVEKRIVNDKVNMYNVITKYHINAFAEGILTSSGIDSLYEIKDMKYQKDERKINKKEDFENIPDKYFEGLRISEWKNTSGEWGKTLEETIQTRIIDLEK